MPTKEKNKWTAFFKSRWFLMAIFVFTVLVIFVYVRAYYRDYQVNQEIAHLQDEVKRLENKKMETIELLKFVQSKDFVEQKARTELNLVKPGEQLTVIDGGTTTVNPGQENDKMLKLNNISNPMKWWLDFVGGE